MKNLNAFQTAVFTARLSATYRHATWSRHPQDEKAVEKFQYWFASAIPDMDTKVRIETRLGTQNPARRPMFHPLQFLNVMRLALILSDGNDNARPDIDHKCRNQYGTACLMVSDLFLSPDEQNNIRTGSTDDRRKQLMLQFLATLEVSNPTPLRHLLFRAYATYRIALADQELTSRIMKECGGLDIEKEFEDQFGITLFAWLSLVFKLPEKDRWKVFTAWGLLFEKYVTWLLRGLHGRHSAEFFPDTCWENGEKSFDTVFVKRRMVVAIEFKGGFLPQNARYSNDLGMFMNTLQGRIGEGCTQLARDIGALFPATGKGKKLRNVPIPSNVLYVLPILVVQDLMLRTPFVNYFLNQQFQAELSKFPTKKSVKILPLNVIQITDLESLVELAEAIDLDVMHTLHRRSKESPDMLKEMPDVVSEVDLNPEQTSPRFNEIYEKSNDEMCAILFPGP